MPTTTRNSKMIAFARANRQDLTTTETRIWQALRGDVFGVRFRRQHPVDPYILDFACLALRLAIEIGGSQHLESTTDPIRDTFLRSQGWTVLRFSTLMVVTDFDTVLGIIGAGVERLQAQR